jgi:hypothetical protein
MIGSNEPSLNIFPYTLTPGRNTFFRGMRVSQHKLKKNRRVLTRQKKTFRKQTRKMGEFRSPEKKKKRGFNKLRKKAKENKIQKVIWQI